MVFDPKKYRNIKDGVGDPSDEAAVNSTDDNTLVALAKGTFELLSSTGISIDFDATNLGTGTATNALRVVTASNSPEIALLTTLLDQTNGIEGPLSILDDVVVADNAAFTDGTTKVSMSGFIFDEVAGTALTENDAAAARVDAKRAQVLVLEDATTRGQRVSINASGQLSVTITAGAATIGKAEDVASADADVGVPAMAVRKATPANTSGTDGDYEMLQMANGRLWVRALGTDANDVAWLSAANALNSTGAGLRAVQLVGQFDDASPTAITENQFGNLRMSANRNMFVTLRDAAGNERGLNINANSAASVAFDQTTSGTTNGVVPHATAASGGIASTSRIVSAAASTNATSAKGSAGRVYAIQGYNAATAVRYLKLYNKATSPTVGSDTPVKTLALPPSAGFAFDWPHGYSFATGIGYALTTGSADADTGALTAGDVLGLNVDYT